MVRSPPPHEEVPPAPPAPRTFVRQLSGGALGRLEADVVAQAPTEEQDVLLGGHHGVARSLEGAQALLLTLPDRELVGREVGIALLMGNPRPPGSLVEADGRGPRHVLVGAEPIPASVPGNVAAHGPLADLGIRTPGRRASPAA